jgi:hypothetical protein
MVTKNNRVLTLARRGKPDGQCLTVFITALLTTAIPHAWNHVQIISDASANIKPITAIPEKTKANDCPAIVSQSPSLQQTTTLLSPVIEKGIVPNNPSPVVVTTVEPKVKPVVHKIKAVAVATDRDRKHQAKVATLRMKVIGAQDGIAWYVDGDDNVKQVAVGDVVPGIGQIGVIRNDRTIKTADGRSVLTEQVN